jgi:hypothetical protein
VLFLVIILYVIESFLRKEIYQNLIGTYCFIRSNVLMYNNIIYPSLDTRGLGRQRIDKMSSNTNGMELFCTPSFLPQKSPDFWNAASFFKRLSARIHFIILLSW